MRGKVDLVLRQKVIDLRVNKRMSFDELVVATGVAKGTLAGWLTQYPLTEQERAARKKVQLLKAAQAIRKDRGPKSRWYSLVGSTRYTRAQKAKIAEAAILFRLVLYGFNVYGPVFDGDRTDWLAENGETGKLFRIQVKWAKQGKNTLPQCSLRCAEGAHGMRRYRVGEFDAVVAYDLYGDTAYVFGTSDVQKNRAAVTIAPQYAERWDKLK